MNSKRKRRWLGGLAGLGLMLATLSGCQTYIPGADLTLPSGHYLDHMPEYTPSSPPYPLPRELANQQITAAQPAAAGLPPQVPGIGGGVP